MPEKRYAVAQVDELALGQRKIIDVGGKSVGLFNVNGEFVAVLNYCPHEGAPVCQGRVSGTTLPSAPNEFKWGRQGEILLCPWHGWEFDLTTGECLTDRRKLRRYQVDIENGTLYLVLNDAARATSARE
ncbi:MAG: Rieske (2Fe-2S) protein [Anaerolineae bacterium]|nr:Rieske (2Fe-2S) protein [Anaerolineae bacterium]